MSGPAGPRTTTRRRPPPRVVVADSQAAERAGIRAVLEAGGLDVCAGAGDAATGLAAALAEVPDVAVVTDDLRGGGIALTAEIARRLPSVRIVVLAEEPDDETMLQALRVGASGYLPKATSLGGLARAVAGVTAGEAAVSRAAAGRLVQEYCDRARRRLTVPGRPDARLTEREWDVLELMGDGAGTAAIAARLQISPVTVRRHASAVMRKLDVADRRAAVDLLAAPGDDPDDLDSDALIA